MNGEVCQRSASTSIPLTRVETWRLEKLVKKNEDMSENNITET